ncbi:hypothetical protein Tco_0950672 [Tanacetum coccineum]
MRNYISTSSCDPPQSVEDRLKLVELMTLCTKLQKQVLDLEEAKTAQAKEFHFKTSECIALEEEKDFKRLHGSRVVAEKEVAEKEVSVATASATTTVDELTLAQTLIEIKAVKPKAVTTTATIITTVVASTRPKATGIVFHDQEEQASAFTPIAEEQAELEKGLAARPPSRRTEQFSIEESPRWLVRCIAERKKFFAAQRAAEQRSKPPTKNQIRNRMCTYLKNMGGYKHNHLKGRSYKEFQKLFDKAYKQLESDKSKKQKIVEHVEAEKDDQEGEEMKRHIEIVKDNEVGIDAIPLATKPPVIVEYKIDKDGRMGYFKLIRADGSSKRYSSMIKMLQDIDREDLETLWKLVKAKHGNTRPEEDYERVLWGDLKVMFEPDIKSEVWRNLQGYKVTIWKLFDTCGVHFVRFKNLHIFMLVEKRYPLTPITITNMLNKKLQADHWNEMCYQLLKLMTKQEKGQ